MFLSPDSDESRRRLTSRDVLVKFLMDARLAIPTPEQLSFEQAAAVGVGNKASYN